MKKVGSLLLAVLMVLSLAACGKTPGRTHPDTLHPTKHRDSDHGGHGTGTHLRH